MPGGAPSAPVSPLRWTPLDYLKGVIPLPLRPPWSPGHRMTPTTRGTRMTLFILSLPTVTLLPSLIRAVWL